MSIDPKIYTAAEVASAGFSQQEIDEELAIITRKAYRAAKAGRGTCVHHAPNLNFLKEVAIYLEELGYIAEILRQAILGPTIIIRWDNKETEPTPTELPRLLETEQQQ